MSSFKYTQSAVLVALLGTLTTNYVTAEYYSGTNIPAANLVVSIVFSILSLILACVCMQDLMKREQTLPPEQKCMAGGTLCGYWCICILFGCIGTGIFYLLARQEIDRRVFIQNGGGVAYGQMPVQVVQTQAQPTPVVAQPVAHEIK